MSEPEEYYNLKKVPVLTSEENFLIWRELFLAQAKKKGYKDVLTKDSPKIPKSTKENPSDDEKKLIQYNDSAFTDLMLAVDTKKQFGRTTFNILKSTKNKDFEDGNAREAWLLLDEKYNPKNAPNMSKVKKQYRNARLQKG